jgi:RNA polymerase sigma-70 factor (ECF subfamily)
MTVVAPRRVTGSSKVEPRAHARASDRDLVVRLRAGDPTAYDGLIRRYGSVLQNTIRHIAGDTAWTEDTLQDAYVSVVRFIGSFRGDSRLTTWLHRVTVNAALMQRRWRRRRPLMSTSVACLEEVRAGRRRAAPDETAVEALSRREVAERVANCVRGLPSDLRGVVELHDLLGRSLRETGSLLGLGLGATKNRLRRARARIRDCSEHPEICALSLRGARRAPVRGGAPGRLP